MSLSPDALRRCLAAAAALVAATGAVAKDVPYDVNSCWHASWPPPVVAEKDLTILHYTVHGIVHQSNTPDKSAENRTFACWGVLRVMGPDSFDFGHCKHVAPNGDSYMSQYQGTGAPGTADRTDTFYGGTGQFKGVSGGGSYRRVSAVNRGAAPNTGQACSRARGTMKLPD
jgi:hypothetical protein